ncbi:MAG: hypothetical protein ABIO70_32410 [Pseudomonadota bacterium]
MRVAGFGWQYDGGGEGSLRWADLDPVQVDDHALWLEDADGDQNICLGDSGGPALLPGSEGGWVAAAINVQLVWYNENYACMGSGARSIRLDTQRSWVEQWVALLDYDAWLEQYGSTVDPGDSGIEDAVGDSGHGADGSEREDGGCGCGQPGGRRGLLALLVGLGFSGLRSSQGRWARAKAGR